MTPPRVANETDFRAVVALLNQSDLPHEDLDAANMREFLVVEGDAMPLGAVGLERFGVIALLRSFAVAPERRRSGLGAALVEALEARARNSGVRELYLLTTTAADYFERRGYHAIPRAQAPAAMQATAEFSSLCPSRAVCMLKKLN